MKQQPSLFLVRHAESEFNLAQMKACKSDVEVKDEDLNVKFDPALEDCGISEHGYQQASGAGTHLNGVNVTLVICSPLRRCLQTAHEIFKTHPNKPKIVAWPYLKEMLLSACDVADDLNTIRKEFPECDFSALDLLPIPELWLLYSLKNETIRQDLMDELFKLYPVREDAIKNARFFINEKLRKLYPAQLECQLDLNQRVLEAKRQLQEKLNELKEGEAITVVAHSRFLEAFSAERYEEDGTPVNAHWFKNCEVIPFELK